MTRSDRNKTLVRRGRGHLLPTGRNLLRLLGALAFLGATIFASPATAQPDIDIVEEIGCLALNIYFEARGEPELGKVAVAHVVMNRVTDKRFPTTVCEVVRQGGERKLHRCQFSWWCDGRSDKPRDRQSWQAVQTVAKQVYWGFFQDPTYGALWYHADSVSPYWGKVFDRGPQIGQHIFYLDEAIHASKVSVPQLSALPIYD